MLKEEEVGEVFEKFVHQHRDVVNDAILGGSRSVLIDFLDLDKFDGQLADQLLEKPEETLGFMEESIGKLGLIKDCHVRFKNLPESTKTRIRDIRSKHLAKLILIEGLIRQATEVRPEITIATYQCDQCGGKAEVIQEGNLVKKPSYCFLCGKKGQFTVLEQSFVDVQKIVVEESPEKLRGSEQPSRINAILRDDMVDPELRDKLTPGNQVEVVGILKEVPIFTQGGAVTARFDLMLMVNSVQLRHQEFEQLEISLEEVQEILQLAADKNIVEKIIASIAPSIYGYEKVKEGIALQLFGGVQKVRKDGVRTRGDIHLLLVGDPGSGKSQLLKYVSALAPKARYVTGKGATTAGLTATVVKDEFLRGWALEAGALVLASGGIACIDELDKMGAEDRVSIHEAMEQQSISIAKANVHATLRAQTAVLGAANPKYGRFDPFQPIADQINMPETLLSRFDMIFPIRDVPDTVADSHLADHILSLHKDPESIKPIIPTEVMRNYIAYSRKHIRPELDDEAVEEIKSFFVGLRGKYSHEETAAVPISPRQLEALVRLSEASARMRLSNQATKEDAQRAIELLKFCLYQVGVDPETGKLDIDRLEGVTTASRRGKIMVILQLLKEMEEQYKGPVPKFELIEKAKEKNVEADLAERLIEEMKMKGDIYEPRSGFIQKL